MSILDKISKPADRPVIVTVTGDGGLGKTSLAATFPNPVFIRVEDGLQAIPEDVRPDAFPVITKVDDLWEQISGLIKEDHDYETAVIDTVTQADVMFVDHVVESDAKKPRSINQALGGYGAGWQAVAQMHQRLRNGVDLLNTKRGMHIVFLAHADTVTIEPPDGDPYTRYDLRMHKKCVSPYIDNVDIVGFIRLKMFTHGDGDRKQAISTGERIVTSYTTAANVSKNRYGITKDLPFKLGENPFTPYVKSLQEIK